MSVTLAGIFIVLSKQHPLNADVPILVVLLPKVTFVKVVTPLNVDGGIYPETVIDAGNLIKAFESTLIDGVCIVILLKEEHPLNADAPILVVLLPMVTLVKFDIPVNADGGIYPETVIDAGNPKKAFDTIVIDGLCIVIFLKEEQPLNADVPILVVLLPMVTLDKVVIPVNADGDIYPETVIDAGNPTKAFDTIVIAGLCILISLREEHPSNADAPILVIFFDMVILNKFILLSK
jgi:hypothetical protein